MGTNWGRIVRGRIVLEPGYIYVVDLFTFFSLILILRIIIILIAQTHKLPIPIVRTRKLPIPIVHTHKLPIPNIRTRVRILGIYLYPLLERFTWRNCYLKKISNV